MNDEQLRRDLAELKARVYELSKRLRGEQTAEAISGDEIQVLISRVNGDQIGFLIDVVDEVVPVAAMAPLPEAPPWLCGMLNIRGDLLPVLDVAGRVTRSAREIELSDLVVVTRYHGRKVGLLVQDVQDIRTVATSALHEATADIPHGPYLLGVLKSENDAVLLFSVQQLVSMSDIPSSEEVAERPSAEKRGKEAASP